MTLAFEPGQEPPSRERLGKVFTSAEASLRLEGMTPTPFFFALKGHVLAGEITLVIGDNQNSGATTNKIPD
jgi:hypothetical protein